MIGELIFGLLVAAGVVLFAVSAALQALGERLS